MAFAYDPVSNQESSLFKTIQEHQHKLAGGDEVAAYAAATPSDAQPRAHAQRGSRRSGAASSLQLGLGITAEAIILLGKPGRGAGKKEQAAAVGAGAAGSGVNGSGGTAGLGGEVGVVATGVVQDKTPTGSGVEEHKGVEARDDSPTATAVGNGRSDRDNGGAGDNAASGDSSGQGDGTAARTAGAAEDTAAPSTRAADLAAALASDSLGSSDVGFGFGAASGPDGAAPSSADDHTTPNSLATGRPKSARDLLGDSSTPGTASTGAPARLAKRSHSVPIPALDASGALVGAGAGAGAGVGAGSATAGDAAPSPYGGAPSVAMAGTRAHALSSGNASRPHRALGLAVGGGMAGRAPDAVTPMSAPPARRSHTTSHLARQRMSSATPQPQAQAAPAPAPAPAPAARGRARHKPSTSMRYQSLAAELERRLHKVQSNQIFLGLVAARVMPKPKVSKMINNLMVAGVRFVL